MSTLEDQLLGNDVWTEEFQWDNRTSMLTGALKGFVLICL